MTYEYTDLSDPALEIWRAIDKAKMLVDEAKGELYTAQLIIDQNNVSQFDGEEEFSIVLFELENRCEILENLLRDQKASMEKVDPTIWNRRYV